MSSAGALICRITGTPVNDSETKHDNRVAAETEPLRMVDDVHDRIHRRWLEHAEPIPRKELFPELLTAQ